MKNTSKLSPKKRYLQIALNSTLDDAEEIISHLPQSDRIIIEAGTPLIKRYGEEGIAHIKNCYEKHLAGHSVKTAKMPNPKLKKLNPGLYFILSKIAEKHASPRLASASRGGSHYPYVVADLKMMDRGQTEVEMAARAGADAAVALGHAPKESLDAFIEKCNELGLDAMIDMMNVEFPLSVLRPLKKQPAVVILHRGVDEEHYNKESRLPLHEIRRIKSNYNTLIAVAGGDTIKEVQSAIFNDADIVVVWKNFYHSSNHTPELAEQFLKEIK